MQIGRWSFQPALAPTAASMVVFPLLLALGFWQLDRADQKQALLESSLEKSSLDPVDLNQESSLRKNGQAMMWRRCLASGRYSERVFLLDNQVVNGVHGYLVFSPFKLAGSGPWVVVNRGWVPAGNYRDVVPETGIPEEAVTISGIAQQPPSAGLFSGGQTEEKMGNGVSRMQSIRLDILENILGQELLSYVIRLEPSSPTGFVREWAAPGSGRERHLGYAFQWFALAAVLAVIYFSVNLRRQPSRNE
jgi:surfeit locus 1 family protein